MICKVEILEEVSQSALFDLFSSSISKYACYIELVMLNTKLKVEKTGCV